MLCTVSHQSYEAHQHVPQVAAEHLDLTGLENCVLLLLLLSLWPRNDSNPVIPVFWEKRGSDWAPCLCCAHFAVRSLNSATLAQSPSWFCFLFSYSLLSWWMPCDGVLPSEWQLEWKLCALQKTQCWSCRCVSLCCVTGKWSYQHVKCALPSMRCDSCRRAEWQEWLLKAVDDPCCWGGVCSGSWRAAPLPVLGPCVMESHQAGLLWVLLASWDVFQQPRKELNGCRCFLLTGAGSLKGSWIC